MNKRMLFLALSVAILLSDITATLLIAEQDTEQSQVKESRDAAATATVGIADYVQSINISVGELQRPGPNEFDVRISVAIVDGKEKAIRSVDVVCPGGKEISITTERQEFDGREHFAAAMREGEDGPFSFAYMNIGAMSIEEYGIGTYSIRINHESGSEQISIPSVDSATGARLKRPVFPKLTSKLEGTLTSPIVVNSEKTTLPAGLFFGKTDPQSQGFTEVVNGQIPAGETTTGPIELSSGTWGGDIGVASENSGTVNEVSWSISFSAVVEFDFEVK